MKGKRYDAMRRKLAGVEGLTKIELDEDWIPPHKSAGFLPYDAILTFEDTDDLRWTRMEVEAMLEENGVEFDEICSFESSGDGSHELFLSLATGYEQGITSKPKEA